MFQTIVDTIATIAARIEEFAYPRAFILHGFPRSIQQDTYSCGAKSIYSILRYFDANAFLKQVLKRFQLSYRIIRKSKIHHLAASIHNGNPVLISVFDDAHYAVVYGYPQSYIFVMNPSMGGMGSVWCAVRKDKFRKIWDHWGLIVSRKSRRIAGPFWLKLF